MIIIVSLLLALIVMAASNSIRKHAGAFYVAALVLSIGAIVVTATGFQRTFPVWINQWIWPILSKGTLATAFFVIVMYTGALPGKSGLVRKLMPIRAELSIIATILTLGHNIAFGITYFRMMFVASATMPKNQFIAGVLSIIMMAIMIPLCITSFKSVRSKMKGRTWKKLQRLAYVFYALIYCHVLILLVPLAKKGITIATVTVIAYSFVFLLYGGMRISKAVKARGYLLKGTPYAAALAAFVAVCLLVPIYGEPATGNDIMEVKNGTPKSVKKVVQDEETGDDAENSSDNSDNETPDSNVDDKQDNQKQDAAATDKKNDTSGKDAVKSNDSTQGKNDKSDPKDAQPQAPPQKYKDGVFTGSAKGFNGPVTVKVVLKGDVITSVSVVSHTDDEPYFSNAKAVLSKITDSQSTSVSAVSGATFSSNGIINAAKNALSSARN